MRVQRELTIEDYKAIARRRIWLLVIPAVLGAIGAYVIAIFLPRRYTSETVVLVEQPSINESIIKPVLGVGDANQRLASMQEQILSRTGLQQIIEKFSLYKDERNRTLDEQVVRLRKSITVSPVRPMAETRASGLPGFTVSVVASEALLAQHICAEVTSFFMKQNVLLREQRAEDTTQFLTKQLNEAKAKMDGRDAKLAEFKRRNMGQLPDEMQSNFSLLSGLTLQLESVTQAINRAQQDKIFVESNLNEQSAATKTSQAADSPNTLEKQLAALQEQLASLQPRYTDQNPDVIKIKNDIARLREKIQGQNKSRNESARTAEPSVESIAAETPQVQQLRAQLHQIEETIRDRTAEESRIQEQINGLQARVQVSPAVEQEYKSLTRDYQTALNVYNDLLKKQSDSEMATDLERQQQGEQFRVLDAPSLPQEPTFPNRPLFGVGGLLGGLGLGLGIIFLLEAQDTTLHSERDVQSILKLPVLATIPALQFLKGTSSNGRVNAALRRPAGSIQSSIGS
jgi:polysaccharide chain length determinant protein (PEP-CTERM system associated)